MPRQGVARKRHAQMEPPKGKTKKKKWTGEKGIGKGGEGKKQKGRRLKREVKKKEGPGKREKTNIMPVVNLERGNGSGGRLRMSETGMGQILVGSVGENKEKGVTACKARLSMHRTAKERVGMQSLCAG